jgi:hypothetical protein
MPVLSRYDDKIIVIELSGEYSTDDARSVILNTFIDPTRPKDAVLLIDLTDSRSIYQRPSEKVVALAEYIDSFREYFSNRLALVAPDDLKFGLMRMTSVRAESLGIKIEIFRDYAKAREWLLTT